MKHCVIDTNIALSFMQEIIEQHEKIYIPITVIEELDYRKNNSDLSNGKRYDARNAVRLIEKNSDKIVVSFARWWQKIFRTFSVRNNDNMIIRIARNVCKKDKECIFYSNDTGVKIKADAIGMKVSKFKINTAPYVGYKYIKTTQDEQAQICSANYEKCDMLCVGEYGIICDMNGNEINLVVKRERNGFRIVKHQTIKSEMFGTIKEKDLQQRCAIDSLKSDQFTMMLGKAGSGKTLLGLSHAMSQLEQGKIQRLLIIHNPSQQRGCEKIGFIKGDLNEKMLGSSLGGILASKLGGMEHVEEMIEDRVLEIALIGNIRGSEYDSSTIVYVSEAQNSTSEAMKTLLQRIGTAKVIIEGDPNTQVDSALYEGSGNGMVSAKNVFKGTDVFGCSEFTTVYRSKIASIAERMK